MKWILIIAILLSFSASAADLSALSGNGNNKKPVEITADGLEVSQNDKTAVFKGNVLVVQGTLKLRADRMIVYYGSKTQDNASIKLIKVEGRVFLTSPEETGQGDKGYYDVEKRLINLTGNVILTKKNNVIKGNELVYDLNSGKSRIITSSKAKQRVRGLFVPEENKNGGKQ